MTDDKFSHLFNELKKIDEQAKRKEIDNKYNFNIFTILRKIDDEVGLHSCFLAELLNPKNSQMPIFQQMFIDKILNPTIKAQEWDRKILDSGVLYKCQTERYIKGFGRIDIVLETPVGVNPKKIIVIENKIHASDQKKQLQRYFEACRYLGYSDENIYIIYLNKNGEKVSNYGQGNLKHNQFGHITYHQDIIHWLDLCIQEGNKYPHIEQILIQYKRLVQELTGDTRSAKMKKEHVKLLYQDDNFRLAHQLSQSLEEFQIDLQKHIWSEMINVFKEKGYDFIFCDKNLKECCKNNKVDKYYKKGDENRFYGIRYFIGEYKGYNIYCFIQINHNIYYGITVPKNNNRIPYTNELQHLANKIKELNFAFRFMDSGNYLGGNILPSEPVNFRRSAIVYKVVNETARIAWVQQTTDEIINFIEQVKSLILIDEAM
ncbi:PDDEXK-like family protein [Psychrobacter sp. I-STPA10]|uniref:PDDEXK-like family protein n=1 Tax=Psychrobacter sp. I-STPA10 TaxID=2585769 RepID=UPI001E6223B9|nr:PD-(D/E)XK nuclease family protein [Psychrobacter sp. I-STPA10]